MTRSSLIAFAALLACVSQAPAARPLLAELLARPPAAGSRAMSALALEACLRQARELQNQINAGLKNFQSGIIRHERLAKKFQAGFPLYQQKQRAYDAAVANFNRDCAPAFTASDITTVKAKLGFK